MSFHEGEGGCEDPRVVEDEEGTYWLMYTAYDGHVARLSVASSKDLVTWQKHGLAFKDYPDEWAKAGSIASRYYADGRIVAARLGGKKLYHMYYGEGNIKLAVSDDLKTWTPFDHR